MCTDWILDETIPEDGNKENRGRGSWKEHDAHE